MLNPIYASQPDGVQRGIVGDIISRFEKRGFKLTALKLVHATPEHLEKRTFIALQILTAMVLIASLNRLRRPQGQALLPWPH